MHYQAYWWNDLGKMSTASRQPRNEKIVLCSDYFCTGLAKLAGKLIWYKDNHGEILLQATDAIKCFEIYILHMTLIRLCIRLFRRCRLV